jgi:hypothetical protein
MITGSNCKKMYLVYIDESYDTKFFAYSAVFVPAFDWYKVFNKITKWRQDLSKTYGIDPEYELHATKFIRGEGQPHNNRNKKFRAGLFNNFFKIFENLNVDGVCVINAITMKTNRNKLKLFEYTLNRIDICLEHNDACGILVCDEGNEGNLISIQRQLRKSNAIPSKIKPSEDYNRPLSHIIEDPLFKTSKTSYFIQIADMIAFGLLRNEHPVEQSTLPEVANAFDNLDKILIKEAFGKDRRKKGIIRVYQKRKADLGQPSTGKRTVRR